GSEMYRQAKRAGQPRQGLIGKTTILTNDLTSVFSTRTEFSATSCFVGRSNSVRKTRPFAIMGDDSPDPIAVFQRTFCRGPNSTGGFTNSWRTRSPKFAATPPR